MGEIKSALEIALEKADRLGKLSKEELAQQEWTDKGRKIAASFLNSQDEDLQAALSQVPAEHLQAALKGVSEVLVRNIILPQDDLQWQGIKRAMDGLVAIKGSVAMQIIPQIEQLLRNYQQTVTHYQEQFQQQLKGRMEAIRSMGQGGGLDGMDQNEMAAMMKAQDEWNRLSLEIRQQFEQQLEPLKQFLMQ